MAQRMSLAACRLSRTEFRYLVLRGFYPASAQQWRVDRQRVSRRSTG
jgi:hypothetical protein